jgi:hypothetical protein
VLGGIVTVILRAFLDWWRNRDRDDAELIHMATETHLELVQSMQEQIAWLRIEHDEQWRGLQECYALRRAYEEMLKEAKVDYVNRLEDYLEDAG